MRGILIFPEWGRVYESFPGSTSHINLLPYILRTLDPVTCREHRCMPPPLVVQQTRQTPAKRRTRRQGRHRPLISPANTAPQTRRIPTSRQQRHDFGKSLPTRQLCLTRSYQVRHILLTDSRLNTKVVLPVSLASTDLARHCHHIK